MGWFVVFVLLCLLALVSIKLEKALRKSSDRGDAVVFPPKEINKEFVITSKHFPPMRSEKSKHTVVKSSNEARNMHKAGLKARRQGHLRYMFHGEWHGTGLKRIETAHE